MDTPDEPEEHINRWDFQATARWIAEGPRSILFSYDHLLWWDREYHLCENRNAGGSLTTLTVYRPFVCEHGLTWSLLRRCEYQQDIFQTIKTHRSIPAMHISYRRIEETHPNYDGHIRALAETLLTEVRDPPVVDPNVPAPPFTSRSLTGWYYGSVHFVESLRLPNTLKGWHTLSAAIEASAHEPVEPAELIERFATKPLGEPIDLPGPEVPWFYRHIEDWRMFPNDDG